MTSHSLIRKALAIALCTVLAVVFSAAVTGSQVHAKTRYRLPKKIVEYYWADEGLKWIMNKDTFKYNKKGDLIKKVHAFYEENQVAEKHTYILKHKYKKGKKVKTTITRDGEKYAVITYDKKGRISKVSVDYDNWVRKYKYGKKGYLAAIKESSDYDSGTITFKTKLKKGKAKLIKVHYPAGDGDEIFENRYYGSTGLLTKQERPLDDICLNYKYKKKNGLVKKMVLSEGDEVSSWFVYTYGKKKISKTRYARVINNDERTLEGILY